MPREKSGKGNPAHTRMSNTALKTRRSLSWQRGEKRKEARRQAQAARHAANRLAFPDPTPWERAKAARAERRQSLQNTEPKVGKAS